MYRDNYDWGTYFDIVGDVVFNAPYIPVIGGGYFVNSDYHSQGKLRQGEKYLIFQYTLTGSCLFKHGDQEWVVSEGMAFVTFADDVKMSYRYNGENYQHIYMALVGAEELFKSLIDQYGHVFQMDCPSKWFGLVKSNWQDTATCNKVKISFEENYSIASTIISDLMRSGRLSHGLLVDENWLVTEVRRLIQSNKKYLFTVQEVTTTLGYTPQHLTRVFKKELGISTSRFIEMLKIEQAEVLLKFSKLNIKEVSYSIGFDNYMTFLRTFKRVNGNSPADYRKRKN